MSLHEGSRASEPKWSVATMSETGSKRKIPHLGPIAMPSHFDVKVRTLDENRVELNYVERHLPAVSEEDWKILTEQTTKLVKSRYPKLKIEASPEKREVRATVVDEPTRVFGYLFREFLGCYLTAGGDPFNAVRTVINLEALRRGMMPVEKPLFELPEIERVVITEKDLVRKALSGASTEDLLKIRGIIEQELRRREEAGKEA